MTRIAKLYQRLIERRPVSFAEFERLLIAFGYRPVRQRGSHRIWRNDAIGDSRTILPNGKDAHEYQVEQFLDIVEAHGLTLDNRND
jgi:predicted RNA binding protein YcfA (HicA-like mRNA interferase family)